MFRPQILFVFACLFASAPAVAQSGTAAEIDDKAAVSAPMTESQAQCELHVFPTENYLGFNSGLLIGFGAIGAAIDSASHKNRVMTVTDLMKGYLGPDMQIQELTKIGIAKTLKLSADYRVIVEAPTPSHEDAKRDPAIKAQAKKFNADVKAGKRLTGSTNPCYAELILTNLFYHKAMMYGSNLFVPIMFRDFGNGRTTPVTSTGSVKNPLEYFPPKTPDMVALAKTELRDAFAKDFVEWSQKKLSGEITH
ncbi:MAG TPA: hypothetical protein VF509_13920 [Sphingobium sp.]